MTEFGNFNNYDDFCTKILLPFSTPMKQHHGINIVKIELPLVMNTTKKNIVIQNLNNYLNLSPMFNRIKAFFNRIDENECFYIFFENCSEEFCNNCRESLKYYNIKYEHNYVKDAMKDYLDFSRLFEDIYEKINNNYDMKIFSYNRKIFLGEKDKKKRICRFCKRTMETGARFVTEAHAIPALMGNKILFQNEECDECNIYFGSSIENDLDNYTKILRALSGIPGRNGIPEIISKDIKLFYQEIDGEYKGPVIIDSSNNEERKIYINSEYEFIPNNIYRIFSKMFFSVVDIDIVKKFNDTVRWIRYNEYLLDKFPLIAFCFLPNSKLVKPELVTYIKKSNIQGPYAFMEFRFGYYVYIVQIPSKENDMFYTRKEYDEFLKKFPHYKQASFKYIDFSSKDLTVSNCSIDIFD